MADNSDAGSSLLWLLQPQRPPLSTASMVSSVASPPKPSPAHSSPEQHSVRPATNTNQARTKSNSNHPIMIMGDAANLDENQRRDASAFYAFPRGDKEASDAATVGNTRQQTSRSIPSMGMKISPPIHVEKPSLAVPLLDPGHQDQPFSYQSSKNILAAVTDHSRSVAALKSAVDNVDRMSPGSRATSPFHSVYPSLNFPAHSGGQMHGSGILLRSGTRASSASPVRSGSVFRSNEHSPSLPQGGRYFVESVPVPNPQPAPAETVQLEARIEKIVSSAVTQAIANAESHGRTKSGSRVIHSDSESVEPDIHEPSHSHSTRAGLATKPHASSNPMRTVRRSSSQKRAHSKMPSSASAHAESSVLRIEKQLKDTAVIATLTATVEKLLKRVDELETRNYAEVALEKFDLDKIVKQRLKSVEHRLDGVDARIFQLEAKNIANGERALKFDLMIIYHPESKADAIVEESASKHFEDSKFLDSVTKKLDSLTKHTIPALQSSVDSVQASLFALEAAADLKYQKKSTDCSNSDVRNKEIQRQLDTFADSIKVLQGRVDFQLVTVENLRESFKSMSNSDTLSNRATLAAAAERIDAIALGEISNKVDKLQKTVSGKVDTVVLEELMKHLATRDELKRLHEKFRQDNRRADDLTKLGEKWKTDVLLEMKRLVDVRISNFETDLEPLFKAAFVPEADGATSGWKISNTQLQTIIHTLEEQLAHKLREAIDTIPKKLPQTLVNEMRDDMREQVQQAFNEHFSNQSGFDLDTPAMFGTNKQVQKLVSTLTRDFDEKLYLLCNDLSACKAAYQSAARQPFYRCAQWLWTSSNLKLGSAIPWNLQSTNTDPENFRWDPDAAFVRVQEAGLYEISFAFFDITWKPSVQLVVNGESVLSALNAPAYVVRHSSGFVVSGNGELKPGTVTGLSLLPPGFPVAASALDRCSALPWWSQAARRPRLSGVAAIMKLVFELNLILMTVSAEHELLRHRLAQLDFREPFGPDSFALVRHLLADLVKTTDSAKRFKAEAERAREEKNALSEQVAPLRSELARLTAENNQVHMDLVRLCDDRDARDRRAEQAARNASTEIADLKFIISQYGQKLAAEQRRGEEDRAKAEEAFSKMGLFATANATSQNKAKKNASKDASSALFERLQKIDIETGL
ncbi:hypothetical protein HDU82_009212, partial [Entophlyctis luteolus]